MNSPVTRRGWIDDDLTQNSEILRRRPHHPRNLERDEKRLKSIAVKDDKPSEDEKVSAYNPRAAMYFYLGE